MHSHSTSADHWSATAALDPLVSVCRRQSLGDAAARLAEVRQWFAGDLAVLEAALKETRAQSQKPAAHLLRLSGKRIRPLCVMLAARLGGREFDAEVRDLATAAELIHTATLLHDDVIDFGDERRGQPTARLLYGNSASILAGDHLLVGALQRVAGAGIPHLLERLLKVVSQMVSAEAHQLARRGQIDPDPDAYLEIIRGKTAVLFEWSLEAGGSVGGLTKDQIATLRRAGTSVGLAFQLVDDLIDLSASTDDAGKGVLADLREGKMTWPLLIAVSERPAIGTELTELLADPTAETGRLAALADQIRATSGLDKTRAFARELTQKAMDEIATLPPGRSRLALGAVVEAIAERAA